MSASLADLPDDVRALVEPHAAENPATLEAIGVAIAEKRDEAKAARVASGVETMWKDAEEAYDGIDDANRHEFVDSKWSKSMSIQGPVTTGRMPRQPDFRSTVFYRLTARYVDAGAAKVAEILLPADDKAFSFSEMPVPDLIKAKDDPRQILHDQTGQPLMRPAQPGEAVPPAPAAPSPESMPAPAAAAPAPPGVPAATALPPVPVAAPTPQPPPSQPQVPLTVRDAALDAIEQIRRKAKAAETRIYNWMVESQLQAEMRKVIKDAARIGVGVIKAPTPKYKRTIAVTKASDCGVDLTIEDKVFPASEWVDPWNIFPDPACGENIHNGDFIFERDFMTPRQLRELKKLPGYIAAQIDAVLEEGPDKSYTDEDSGGQGASGGKRRKNRYEVWYFYGSIKREEMDALDQAAGKSPMAATPDTQENQEVYAIVTLINERAVRATVNPLDSGRFPYHSVPWQRRNKSWAGVGVAEQMKAPQRITNAALRALLNNAGKSAGSQIIVDQSRIRPADGVWTMTPDKVWLTTQDGAGQPVNQAFMVVEIPNVTDQMMKIVQLGEQLAEQSTSIPLVTQGQSGETSPETFGAAQLQNNNANQLLRDIGYSFDDFITEPMVRQYYEWLLLDIDVPDEEKGEFQINAHGSIALVERAIQDQTVAQMGTVVLNPAFGLNPKKWGSEFLKSKHLDPGNFQYTEEEQAKIDAAPPPEAPIVTVAKINADVAMKELVAKQSTDQQTAQSEERIAQAANALEGGRVQNESQRTLADSTVALHTLQTQRELAMLDYANRHAINLDQVKAALAKTAMTLQTQRELNAQDNATELQRKPERPRRGMTPPGQVPGRAGNGRAFEQGAPQ